MLFHANSTKYVMKSQNQDIIPYKFYQKHHEISKSWRYSLKILRRTPWNLTIMTLFHTNSTKNVKKSQNQDIIPYKFYQKCHEVTQLWRYSIQIQPKNVMKSQNHNIIPFKFFQKCHGFSKSWHYSIQNLPKMSRYLKNMTLFLYKFYQNIIKSHNHDIIPYKFYKKHHEMSWSHTNMKLFHTNSTKNVIKSLNHGYYMQILPKASWNLEIMILFLQILQNKLYEI